VQHHQAAITQPDFFLFYQEEKDYYDKATYIEAEGSDQLIILPLFLHSSVFIFIRPFGLLLLRRGSRHNLVVSSSICQEMYYNHISLSIRHHHIEGASGFHQRSLILAAYIYALFLFILYI